MIALTLLSALSLARPAHDLLLSELKARYPHATVAVEQPVWRRGEPIEHPMTVQILGEDGQGRAQFRAHGRSGSNVLQSEGDIRFTAIQKVPFARQRVLPGATLSSSLIENRELDVAVNPSHAFRASLAAADLNWASLEARGMLTEGQPILSQSLGLLPLVRTGTLVRVKLKTRDLVIWSKGVVQEAGSLGQLVRVMSTTSGTGKRSLEARVLSADTVEVAL